MLNGSVACGTRQTDEHTYVWCDLVPSANAGSQYPSTMQRGDQCLDCFLDGLLPFGNGMAAARPHFVRDETLSGLPVRDCLVKPGRRLIHVRPHDDGLRLRAGPIPGPRLRPYTAP